MSNSFKRNSNLELLRIFSMLCIVACHYAVHGIKQSHWGGMPTCGLWLEGSDFKVLFTSFLIPGGEIGVAIFFILTGYFQIKSNVKSIKILRMLLQVLYYSVFSLVIFFLTYILKIYNYPEYLGDNGLVSGFTARYILRSTMPVLGGSWWFVTAYFTLYLITPLLNTLLCRLNRKGFIFIILVLWVFWYTFAAKLNTSFFILQKAVFYYSLGGYLRYYGRDLKSTMVPFVVSLILWICLGLQLFFNVRFTEFNATWSVIHELTNLVAESVFKPIIAVSIFLIFKSIQIENNRVINLFSATTFGVYLIHDSEILRALIWNKILSVISQYNSHFYPLLAVFSIVIVFTVCSVIELLRIKYLEDRLLIYSKCKIDKVICTFTI